MDAACAADVVDVADAVGGVYGARVTRRAVAPPARTRASQGLLEVGAGAGAQAMPAVASIATPIFGFSGTKSSCLRYSSMGC